MPSTRTGTPTGPLRVEPAKPAMSVRSGAAGVAGATSSTDSPGSMAAGSAIDLEAFVGDHERLDRDLVVAGVERRSGVLRGPGPVEVPPHDLLTVLVEEKDRPGGPPDAAVERLH